eukprot:RCo018265
MIYFKPTAPLIYTLPRGDQPVLVVSRSLCNGCFQDHSHGLPCEAYQRAYAGLEPLLDTVEQVGDRFDIDPTLIRVMVVFVARLRAGLVRKEQVLGPFFSPLSLVPSRAVMAHFFEAAGFVLEEVCRLLGAVPAVTDEELVQLC